MSSQAVTRKVVTDGQRPKADAKKQPNSTAVQRQNERNYLGGMVPVGSYSPVEAKKSKQPSPPKPHNSNSPWHNQGKPSKELVVTDSLDQELQHVDSGLFKSQAQPSVTVRTQPLQDGLDKVNVSTSSQAETIDPNAKYSKKAIPTQVDEAQKNPKSKALKKSMKPDADIDDSQFYYKQGEMFGPASKGQVQNQGEKIIEKNIRGVLETHHQIHKDHNPCKVPV